MNPASTHRARTFGPSRSGPTPLGFGLLFDRAVVGVLGTPGRGRGARPAAGARGDASGDQTMVAGFVSPR
ncbi:MAG: hypothetical protein S0880_09975 [Actinomycetota bacterium]|nr:hypothetical protein [Actinomycetota bacterium]